MSADRLSVFPAFHKVAGRTVLVVGNEAAATAKVRLLLETEAKIRLVARSPSAELVAVAGTHAIELRRRGFLAEDLDGAVLAFAASGEREEDAAVVAAARARKVPVNAVDLPELCDFYTPAIVNRAPVAVAIGSTGAGPVLAQKLRARIEALLPLRLGMLAKLGESFRPAADKVLPKGQPRRRFWSAFFEGRVADAALAGRPEEARRLASRLLTEADSASRGFVWFVGAGPGVADLLTLRAQCVLLEADVIVHDTSVPDAVIAIGRRDAARIAVDDRYAPRPDAAAAAAEIVVREAESGRRVVRLHSGDALASEAAGAEAAALAAAGLSFEFVPGVATVEPLDARRVMAA